MYAADDLQDARSSLEYWRGRARALPRRRWRMRREAREMTARWEARVAESERAAYGRGLVGALVLLLAEGRLPQRAQRTGRLIVRRTAQAAAVAFAFVVLLGVASLVVLVELLQALL